MQSVILCIWWLLNQKYWSTLRNIETEDAADLEFGSQHPYSFTTIWNPTLGIRLPLLDSTGTALTCTYPHTDTHIHTKFKGKQILQLFNWAVFVIGKLVKVMLGSLQALLLAERQSAWREENLVQLDLSQTGSNF